MIYFILICFTVLTEFIANLNFYKLLLFLGVYEEETWKQIQKIRNNALSLEEKRQLKRQILSAPMLRTRGLAQFKLSRRKFTSQVIFNCQLKMSKFTSLAFFS